MLRIGRKLHVLPGPWQVVVAKRARLLTVWQGKRIFAVYPIGIGRNDTTPTGRFVICRRRLKPVYTDPQGRKFHSGHDKNPLGAACLDLALEKEPKTLRGYSIHGTSDQISVGRSVSNGCVRMRNEDIKLLYTLLPEKTPVEIRD